MNYNHAYHAGNFADVFKHIILSSILKSISQKPTPLCYVDTYAGCGYYDLLSVAAQKTKESDLGIKKLFAQKNPPNIIREYLLLVQQFNNRLSHSAFSSLRYYPGSPAIARHFLRPHDRMVLSELHPSELQLLKKHFANDSQVSSHLMDGYQGLKAFLPPKERRGLVLIDPPYERPHELKELVSALPFAIKRFSTGIYAIWHPIKDRLTIERFYQKIKGAVQRPLLAVELTIYPGGGPMLLSGCSMLIINPPWQLNTQINLWLPFLWKTLAHHGQGHYSVKSL